MTSEREIEDNNYFWNFIFSGRWFPEVKTCFLEGIRLVRAFGESRDLVFSSSRSNLGLMRSRLAGFVRNREIYNMGMVSGPVLLKQKVKAEFPILVWVKNETQNQTVWWNWSNVGPWSSEWYRKDLQGRRGYVLKFWVWKIWKKMKITCLWMLPIFSLGVGQNGQNPHANGWPPYPSKSFCRNHFGLYSSIRTTRVGDYTLK